MLLPIFLTLLTSWDSVFPTDHTTARAVRHALALVAALGRLTITAMLRALYPPPCPRYNS